MGPEWFASFGSSTELGRVRVERGGSGELRGPIGDLSLVTLRPARSRARARGYGYLDSLRRMMEECARRSKIWRVEAVE
jgi:hypothetical protein